MKLYIVRHAIAESHGTPGISDDDRPLTEEGRKKMRQAAAGLLRLGYIPEVILSSPLPRARQTAEILLEAFGGKTELKIAPSLAPSGARKELYGHLRELGQSLENVMIVGHQPSLGEIAGEIVWGSAEHYIDLKKGGACVVDLESLHGVPKGTLVSLLPPSVLRQLAEVS
jgi:phosphohistidine phosphatase